MVSFRLREPCGRACSLQAAHWLSEGLADYNPGLANPSVVWADDNAYHNTPPKVVAKRVTTPSFRPKGTARSLRCGLSWRFFRCRSPGRECTRMAGIRFSSCRVKDFFVCPSLYSPGERLFLVALKKFF